MLKKFTQIILLCVSGLAYADTGHDLEAGIVHIRGVLVNGTCVVDSYNKGMYVKLFDPDFAGKLVRPQNETYKLFYLNFSSCPYFLYDNTVITFESPAGGVNKAPTNYRDWVDNKLPFNSIKETVNEKFPLPFSRFVNGEDKLNLYVYSPGEDAYDENHHNDLMIVSVYYP
ncbi:hypothetical protein [Tatumella sp. JGM118]|uniref:hypothetical protein n=1 Tax=Tatumella sp. JGM118 TaxID=2799796 RepID=UPI001BAF0488|nr:hypothetical protein [Tatumella sp. JGM118]MBS0909443.1 hypothetical protein [Tatumella sp. JGM118]